MSELHACGGFKDRLDIVVSKENDTSWITSGLRAWTGATAVDGGIEAVAVAGMGVDVHESAVAGDTFGVSALSLVGLWGAELKSLDTRNIGVIGLDGKIDSA